MHTGVVLHRLGCVNERTALIHVPGLFGNQLAHVYLRYVRKAHVPEETRCGG